MEATRIRRFLLVLLVPLLTLLIWGPTGPLTAQAATGTQSDLTATSGQGAGRVLISSTAAGQGTFMAQVTVNIHATQPDDLFSVTRAVDLVPDGICTMDSGFVTVASLTTSAGGAGAVHFVREGGTSDFDVILRVVDSTGTVLQSACMTVRVK